MKNLVFLVALSALVITTSTSDIVTSRKFVETQNVPCALYPLHLTVYTDHAWYGINSWDKPTIRSYVKLLYGKDKTFCKYLLTTIRKESSFDPNAISPTSARGLMQLFSAASIDMGYNYNNVIRYPWININCGARYLKFCLKRAKNDYTLAYKYYVDGPWAALACNKNKKIKNEK